MRSTAPASASAPPLISASLVLVGKSTASPVGAFRPAVPISRRAASGRSRAGSARRGSALGIDRVDRDRRAHHHHQHRPCPPSASTRCSTPIIATQRSTPRRIEVVVAVADAAGLARRNHPARLDIPQLELLLDAALTPSPATTQPSMLDGGTRPFQSVSARVSMVSRNTAPCAISPAPGCGEASLRPFQARVCRHIDGEKTHAPDRLQKPERE